MKKTRAEQNKYALRSGPMDLPYVPRRGYADGPYGQIHYRDTGGGGGSCLPLILLHQAPLTSKQFSRVYGLLRERGIRAIGIDAPGFGESDATTFVPTIEDWAAIVPTVLDALVVEKANVLGHHTGALVATEVALQFPDRVNKVVLNGPFPIESEERRLEYLKYVEEKINHVYEADGSHLLNSFNLRTQWWNKALGDGKADPKLFTRYLIEKYQGYAPFWTGHHAAFIYDQVESLKRIEHPTMILTNTGDMANENAKLAHELRPDFLYKEMEGGTFDIVDQMPIEWTDEVVAFLRD